MLMDEPGRDRDVRAILDAAGCYDLRPEQYRRARAALIAYTTACHPRLVRARERWRRRALYLRDKHSPRTDWGPIEIDPDPLS